MKNFLSVFLLLTAFSFQSIAQNPTDDEPGDPGGDVYTYENGYAEGAAAAMDLKMSLASSYGATVDFIEWHLFDENYIGNLGASTSFNAPGLKIPVIIWSAAPSQQMLQDASAASLLSALEQYQYDSDFDSGYYQGFLYHWYNSSL